MSMGRPWVRTLPAPDGGFDQSDRQHLALGYAGSVWTDAVVIPVGPYKELYATFSLTKDLHADFSLTRDLHATLE